MMGNIETGNYMTEGGSVKSKKKWIQDRTIYRSEKASEKLIPNLTFCLWFVR